MSNELMMSLEQLINERKQEDYNAVYLLDIEAGILTPYFYNSDIAEDVTNKIGEGTPYEIVARKYVDMYLPEDSKESFLEIISLDNIGRHIKRKGQFYHSFKRYNIQKELQTVELHVSKIPAGGEQFFVVSFRLLVVNSENRLENSKMIQEEKVMGAPLARTILVVDDNEIYRDVMVEMLQDSYQVMTACNGEEALAMLKKHCPEISAVILDLEMPVMNGYEFMEIVSKNRILKQIPVIVVTGELCGEIEQKCLNSGAAEFITKPFMMEMALARINNVIRLRESVATLRAIEFDELTQLYTKPAFMYHAEMFMQMNTDTDFYLVGIDVENFKLTNSMYGEERCDGFLAYLGKRLDETMRGGIVGRFGGDQFVILLSANLMLSEDELNNKLAQILAVAPIPRQILKCGVYGPVDRNFAMLTCCDRAFWAIKKIKGIYNNNVAYYNDEMRSQLLEEQRIQDSMEEALEREEFKVFYQPKHDCRTGKIVGAEALVRWEHPVRGIISPGKFVPLFERNGFITKVDAYVLKTVCSDLKRWKEMGLKFIPVSVNVSRRDFYEEGWVDQQLKLITDSGLPPASIHIEVTESLYMEDTDCINEQVKRAQEMGYLIEMDDFGIGSSSLSMMTDFPFDVIKLDISFVKNLEKNEVVVDTIIKLAHRLGLRTVAEGVETEKQYLMLRKLECDIIQGYYFSKPLPVIVFEQYLTKTSEQEDNIVQIVDETDTREWEELTKELEIKNTMLKCISILAENGNSGDKIKRLLGIIGRFYGAQSAYIVEFDEQTGVGVDTYEWNANGIGYQERVHQNVFSLEKIKEWISLMGDQNSYYVPSMGDAIKNKPELQSVVGTYPAKSVMTAPLKDQGGHVGFVGVDSPTVHTDAMIVIEYIPSFILNELERGRNIRHLESLSMMDPMTGIGNRRSYYERIKQLEAENEIEKTSVGIVFADVNGLKVQNDRYGHEAGDQLICEIAETLKSVFGDSNCYRIGGDEFVVFVKGVAEEAFYQQAEQLKLLWQKEEKAAVGLAWLKNADRIEEEIEKADQAMYRDKCDYYREQMQSNDYVKVKDPLKQVNISTLEVVADFLPGGFFIYRADDDSIIYHNEEILRIFKCKDAVEFKELTGGKFSGVVYKEDLARVIESIDRQITQVNVKDYVEYRIVCKDGEIKKVRDYGRFERTSLYGDVFYVFIEEQKN